MSHQILLLLFILESILATLTTPFLNPIKTFVKSLSYFSSFEKFINNVTASSLVLCRTYKTVSFMTSVTNDSSLSANHPSLMYYVASSKRDKHNSESLSIFFCSNKFTLT